MGQILYAECNNLLLCTRIHFEKTWKRSFTALNVQVCVRECFELPIDNIPLRSGFVERSLLHSERVQRLASLFAAVMPQPVVHFFERQLVGITKESCSLSNLTYLCLGANIVIISTYYNIPPVIFFLVHTLKQ
jgi:hypothetical protein